MSLFVSLVVLAGPAEARFGKRSAPPSSGGSGSGYRAPPAPQPAYRSGRSSYEPVSSGRYAYGWPRRHASFGYGYGYSYWYQPYPVAPAVGMVAPAAPVAEHVSPIRVTVGVEGQGFMRGATLGLAAAFEGEHWGVSVSAADIIAKADDGSGGVDHIGNLTAHLTYAFLTGQYGRLRGEVGADAFFAPDAIFVGPTAGLSGVVWLGGPVGLEAAVMATPWPFVQLDARAGLALGIENWGFRAGWRVLALNDRGLVDGVAHGDVFNGPYLGVSYVF
ncbi:MAG: hypothetical protein IPJ65_16005 [Archangiaceae bacterium]|nr:hypothetical protein [Archangiaceae bacterium]